MEWEPDAEPSDNEIRAKLRQEAQVALGIMAYLIFCAGWWAAGHDTIFRSLLIYPPILGSAFLLAAHKKKRKREQSANGGIEY